MNRFENKSTCGILFIVNETHSPTGQAQAGEFVEGLKRRTIGVPIATAVLPANKTTLATGSPSMEYLGVRRWLCVPLYVVPLRPMNLSGVAAAAARRLSQRRDVELRWMSLWASDSQFISLMAGLVSKMLLNFEVNPRILLVGGACASLEIFRIYAESAQKLSKLLHERVEPCVLNGLGASLYRVLDDVQKTPQSTLLVPYQAFEGLLLRNLRESLRRTGNSGIQHISPIQALFMYSEIQQYIYSAIESRLLTEVTGSHITSPAYAYSSNL